MTESIKAKGGSDKVEDLLKPYKRLDASDKQCKPMILQWLADLFGYEDYPHSFKDQFITWNIWDGELNIGFDLRQEEQKKLLSLIHPRFKGVPQLRTLKVVNENNFYLDLERLLDINYPNIKGSELIKKDKHTGGKGGWSSKSDEFYTYDWEVFLDDDTSIMYHNQKDIMDMKKHDFVYDSIIQERAFNQYIKTINK